MTDDQIKSLKEDISYMKALADEGSRGPLLGGAILVAAGLIFGAGSLMEWALDVGVLDLQPWAHMAIWGGAMALFTVALIVLIQRQRGRPGQFSPSNQAFANAWMGVGLAIFAMAISISIIGFKLESEAAFTLFPSLIFALYGSGWAISAAMSGQKWLWRPAFGGWAAAPLVAWFTGDPTQWLIYAGGLVLLALVPGVILMRQEPSDVV